MPCNNVEGVPVYFDEFLIVTHFDHIVPSMALHKDSHSFVAKAKNLIRGYLWLSVVIRSNLWQFAVTKSLPFY